MSKMNTVRREPTSDWKNHLTTLRSVSEDMPRTVQLPVPNKGTVIKETGSSKKLATRFS